MVDACILIILIGSYFDFRSCEAYVTTLIFGLALVLGLIGIAYILWKIIRKASNGTLMPKLFFSFFVGFLSIIIDDRIVKFFMANVPFVEAERLWSEISFLPHLLLSSLGRLSKKCVFFPMHYQQNYIIFTQAILDTYVFPNKHKS